MPKMVRELLIQNDRIQIDTDIAKESLLNAVFIFKYR